MIARIGENSCSSFRKGAADFFDRMIKKDELIVRLESRIRTHRESVNVLKLGSLTLDIHKIESFINGERLDLTLLEFKILKKLIQSIPRKIPKDELVKSIWGNEVTNGNNLNSHLYNLRMKVTHWDHGIDNQRFQGFWLRPK